MNYTQTPPALRRKMLDTIGVENVDQLYTNLPEAYRLDEPTELTGLALQGRSELELQRELAALVDANRPAGASDQRCFLGAGSYDHFIPTVVDHLAGQGAFVTAYTPYQAEASQGSLQAFFEFQTQISRLTGLDVANASLYEGATAVAEAVLMALHTTGKRRVLVASTLHPHTRRVITTYLQDLPVELIELPADRASGRVEAPGVQRQLELSKGDTACVVVQSPNVWGVIEDWRALFETTHEQANTLAIAVFNPIACGLLTRPGDCGADVAVGEGQPLGIPMQFGGPYLGLFATRQALMRKMPGRLVGQTVDRDGRRAYCLTLQTREQHIRGDKATSNICTNQGLLALRATIYLNALGPVGLRQVAQQCYHKAHHAAKQIAALEGYTLAYDGTFFHEFVVDGCVPARRIIDEGRKRGILPGLDCHALGIGEENQLLVAVTEKRTAQDIDALVELLREVR